MSKYPRTLHLPFSPGGTNDDKRLVSVDSFIKKPVVITEKLDGSNSCVTHTQVFARSHNGPPKHASFDHLKAWQKNVAHLIPKNREIFGENCFAIHSIEYAALSNYFFIFGVREDDQWLSWQDTISIGQSLNCPTTPVLFEGTFLSPKELEKTINKLCSEKSFFGGDREGVVIRLADSFSNEHFSTSVAKWVRKDHVQTDDHWMFQSIRKQILKK